MYNKEQQIKNVKMSIGKLKDKAEMIGKADMKQELDRLEFLINQLTTDENIEEV